MSRSCILNYMGKKSKHSCHVKIGLRNLKAFVRSRVRVKIQFCFPQQVKPHTFFQDSNLFKIPVHCYLLKPPNKVIPSLYLFIYFYSLYFIPWKT